MFERYNEKARRTIFLARYEASQVGSPEIESEHLLLGILREGRTMFNALIGLHDVEAIRAEIEAASTHRPKTATSVDLPLTNECKRILAYGAEEAMRLSQKHIGIEHLLLGILREEKCFAAKILHKQGVTLSNARKRVAQAEDSLAASAHVRDAVLATAASSQTPLEEVPPTRSPAAIRVAIACGSEVLVAYRCHFGPPRIGEAILMRDDEGATHIYRVQDVVWEINLSEAVVVQEIHVQVTQEKEG